MEADVESASACRTLVKREQGLRRKLEKVSEQQGRKRAGKKRGVGEEGDKGHIVE